MGEPGKQVRSFHVSFTVPLLMLIPFFSVPPVLQYYTDYTCGCRHEGQFSQCKRLRNTIIRCQDRDIQNIANKPSNHYCENHLVIADAPVMMRKQKNGDEDKEGQDEV